MKRALSLLGVLVLLSVFSFAAKVGEAAPDFSATDSNGKSHQLSSYRGKYVVLEWHNQGCPYTKKHYETGNMQKLQKEWTGKGVVWLSVISSAPGKQGYVTASEENDYLRRTNSTPTAVLLDPKGDVGRMYGAKTTPHMYIIDPQGNLIYNGAIDDRPTADQGDVAGAKNYVSQALDEAMAGKAVSTAATTPYGCTVKYAN
ncbi:MAG: redoxin domain-containing protein [Acidobacteriales bacterium]|nr:redoxin domain-containing protein [Terriglobales bacterium]